MVAVEEVEEEEEEVAEIHRIHQHRVVEEEVAGGQLPDLQLVAAVVGEGIQWYSVGRCSSASRRKSALSIPRRQHPLGQSAVPRSCMVPHNPDP